jgi:5-methylcytosine-specific restriction endonuclease McrA
MLPKPSRLLAALSKWQRQQAAEESKRAEAKATKAAWLTLVRQVAARDGGHCKVCGVRVTAPGDGDPRRFAHTHHIVYRSAGGSDDLSNLVLLCGQCHDDEHQHRITLTGTADRLRPSKRIKATR